MPFILLLIGAVIIIAAFNNTQGDLATELETDVPAFLKWALAIVGVGAIGWIPGMQTISRWLLALVLVVLVLKNYQGILSGFQSLGGSAATAPVQTAANPTPASAYIANPNNPQVTQAQISGTSGNVNAAGQPAQIAASPFGAFDPHQFLAAFEAGFGGFGGIA